MRRKLEQLLLRLDAMRDVALWRSGVQDSRAECSLWLGQAHGLQIASEEIAEILQEGP